jgi:hypothetical protein
MKSKTAERRRNKRPKLISENSSYLQQNNKENWLNLLLLLPIQRQTTKTKKRISEKTKKQTSKN